MMNRWSVLALFCTVRVALGFQFQSVPPIAAFLVADVGFSNAQVGALVGLFLLPGSVLALLGGVLAARIGEKRTLLAGLGLMAAGALLFSQTRAFPVALAGRMVSGGGVVLLTAVITKVIADWFAGKEIATAMSCVLATWPLGIAGAFATLGNVAAASSWQTAVLVTAAFPLAGMAAIGLLYRPPPVSAPISGALPAFVLSRREAVLVITAALVWLALNASYVVLLSAAPAWLIEQGLTPAKAAATTSITSWMALLFGPVGGFLTDRLRRVNSAIAIGCTGCAIAIWLLLTGAGAGWWLALGGILVAPAVGAIMSLPAEVLRPASRGAGYGLFFTLYYLGLAAFPPIGGWLQDTSGSAAPAIAFSGAMMLATVPALLLFRVLHRVLIPPAAAA